MHWLVWLRRMFEHSDREAVEDLRAAADNMHAVGDGLERLTLALHDRGVINLESYPEGREFLAEQGRR
jgi:hypothetical protein